jgi:hypothetical protein
MCEVIRHGRDDHEVVGVQHCPRVRVVQQQAELHRSDEHRAIGSAQPLHRVRGRAARRSLAGPSEQVDGCVEALLWIPAERVEPGKPAAQVEPERRAGEHLDRRRRRGTIASEFAKQ